MKDFKNSTKTQYMKGGACAAYAKGGSVKGAAKISKVMGEFKSGELHSGSKSGPVVKSPKQAKAIALSEARKAGAKIPMKKEEGGAVVTTAANPTTTATTATTAAAPVSRQQARYNKMDSKFDSRIAKMQSKAADAPAARQADMRARIADKQARFDSRLAKAAQRIPAAPVAAKKGGVMKKANGGSVEAGDVLIARMTKDELAAGPKGIKAAKERLSRDKVKGVMDRETKIKEQVKKAVPVPRSKPLIPNEYEKTLLKRATRYPSVEAGDTDPRLLGMKHGGKVMKKATGGGVSDDGSTITVTAGTPSVNFGSYDKLSQAIAADARNSSRGFSSATPMGGGSSSSRSVKPVSFRPTPGSRAVGVSIPVGDAGATFTAGVGDKGFGVRGRIPISLNKGGSAKKGKC